MGKLSKREVFQENLDSFLAIAEELQLKGLMGKTDENPQEFEGDEKYLPSKLSPAKITKRNIQENFTRRRTPSSKIQNRKESGALAIPSYFSGDLEELEKQVKSMMEKSKNNYPGTNGKADLCKVCGKEGMGSAIKDHIEANHLEGIVIPCNLCDKTFRSRNAFRQHKRQHQHNMTLLSTNASVVTKVIH